MGGGTSSYLKKKSSAPPPSTGVFNKSLASYQLVAWGSWGRLHIASFARSNSFKCRRAGRTQFG